MSAPQRPSDALEHALVAGSQDDRWRGDKRLGRIGVKQLVALRELGWDVVRRPRSQATDVEPSGGDDHAVNGGDSGDERVTRRAVGPSSFSVPSTPQEGA